MLLPKVKKVKLVKSNHLKINSAHNSECTYSTYNVFNFKLFFLSFFVCRFFRGQCVTTDKWSEQLPNVRAVSKQKSINISKNIWSDQSMFDIS